MWNKKHKEPTQKQIIGRIGEDCACEYLKKKGFVIVDRNYLKKWGEIDIVAKKAKKIHFVEVKSVSRPISTEKREVTRGTGGEYRPEDNMHPWKLQRLGRVIQSYLLDKNVSDETDWQFDVATVYIDSEKRLSRVFLLEDIVL
ncbi:MAG: YraN family protein [bacterium]